MPNDRSTTGMPTIRHCGDTALSVDFGDRINLVITRRVMALDAALADLALPGVIEMTPTYRALTVHVDPLTVDHARLQEEILALCSQPLTDATTGSLWRVPVIYGGAFGTDLALVAANAGLSQEDVITKHVAPLYTVAMVGFLPGFSYLSGLDPKLATPRRVEPRLRIPASSVSIGGGQTAISSVEGPSGWHVIGRTPVRPFHPDREPAFLFAPGDRIRFEPVAAAEWESLDLRATQGNIVAWTNGQ